MNSNDSQENELLALIDALDSALATGMPVSKIAQLTELPVHRVKDLLDKHRDYFVAVAGRNTYRLNRFGKFKGSARLMRKDLAERKVESTVLIMSPFGMSTNFPNDN